MIRSTTWTLGLLAVVNGAHAQSGVQSTRDSGGAHTVMNAARASSRIAFIVASKASLDLGGLHDDENYEFGKLPIDAFRLSNGEIVVLDGYALKFFSRDGHFLRRFGKKGEGPDEFRNLLTDICRTGKDSFVVFQGTLPIISVFANSRAFPRTISIPGEPALHGCLNDGTFIVQLPSVHLVANGMNEADYVAISSDGRTASRLGRFPSISQLASSMRPHAPNIRGRTGTVYVADGRTPEFRTYNRNGKLLLVVRTNDQLLPFSADDAERAFQERIGKDAPQSVVASFRDQFFKLPRPVAWPAYSRIEVDDQGRTWMADVTRTRAENQHWTAFDRNGRLLGRVLPTEASYLADRSDLRIIRWERGELVASYVDNDGSRHIAFVPFQPK